MLDLLNPAAFWLGVAFCVAALGALWAILDGWAFERGRLAGRAEVREEMSETADELAELRYWHVPANGGK
ncbi:MAG: hypothetical protein RL134_2520 [Actinomycetota bacterium]|jgi:hypothetical protein